MLIRYQGHSQFLLEDKNGQRVVTDPYDASTGYPMNEVRADAVTVSHAHGDHSFTDKVTGSPVIIHEAGTHMPLPDVKITAIPCFHDEAGGKKRGTNLMMLIEMDGLRVLHCGDLGHLPDDKMLAAAGRVDILLIPVGGFFTIDAAQAVRTAEMFAPAMIIPMHYRTAYNASWPISDAGPFLKMCAEKGLIAEETDVLRVAKEDLSEQPALTVMRMQSGKI